MRYSWYGQMSPWQMLPGQMSPWQLESAQVGPRDLPLKFDRNWVINDEILLTLSFRWKIHSLYGEDPQLICVNSHFRIKPNFSWARLDCVEAGVELGFWQYHFHDGAKNIKFYQTKPYQPNKAKPKHFHLKKQSYTKELCLLKFVHSNAART